MAVDYNYDRMLRSVDAGDCSGYGETRETTGALISLAGVVVCG